MNTSLGRSKNRSQSAHFLRLPGRWPPMCADRAQPGRWPRGRWLVIELKREPACKKRIARARVRARASWGLSGWRGNFCREAPDGLSWHSRAPVARVLVAKLRTLGETVGLSRARIGKAASSRSRSGRTFLNRVRDPFISSPST
jgi:hypothetical protein